MTARGSTALTMHTRLAAHRRSHRTTSLLGAGLLLLAAAAGAESTPTTIDPEQAQSEAQAVVQQTVDAVLAVLQADGLDTATQRERVEAIVYDRFDFATISRLVLARNWRRLDTKQREQFVQEFRQHLSLSYGQTLEQYENQKVVITGTRMETRGDVTVRTEIQGAGAEPVEVIYRLRRGDDGWHVIDVIIESASLIQNFRSQIAEIIRDVGPDGLIDKLREKNAERSA